MCHRLLSRGGVAGSFSSSAAASASATTRTNGHSDSHARPTRPKKRKAGGSRSGRRHSLENSHWTFHAESTRQFQTSRVGNGRTSKQPHGTSILPSPSMPPSPKRRSRHLHGSHRPRHFPLGSHPPHQGMSSRVQYRFHHRSFLHSRTILSPRRDLARPSPDPASFSRAAGRDRGSSPVGHAGVSHVVGVLARSFGEVFGRHHGVQVGVEEGSVCHGGGGAFGEVGMQGEGALGIGGRGAADCCGGGAT
mmetsp:Transcript_19145/g.40227  ORF Transcript_19145/g.40227 Transcript_19145/m.40227 type:complete len:249 (+) Transcript_19145:498-1244(+)